MKLIRKVLIEGRDCCLYVVEYWRHTAAGIIIRKVRRAP